MSSIERGRIVIGDVHGEFAGLREILLHAGLINDRDSWTGGGTLLIQVGDVIDRGRIRASVSGSSGRFRAKHSEQPHR